MPELSAESSSPQRITEGKVVFVEGKDAEVFFKSAIQAYGFRGLQVLDFGGNAEIRTKLSTLRQLPRFEQVTALILARDSETSSASAIQSLQDALRFAELPVPEHPFRVHPGPPRTAFALFPGLDEKGEIIPCGRLEDLCLATVEPSGVLRCADSFVECCQSAGSDMRLRHKMRLHAYLSGHLKFVGMKLGQAASAGAWSWDHPRMQCFKGLLASV